jgi:hypothetical protein
VRQELDPERRALALLAREADVSAHDVGQPLADREPDAGAFDRASLLTSAVEGAEDAILLVGGDSDAVVVHDDAHHRTGGFRAQRYAPAYAPVFDRVRSVVHQDLLEASAIGDDGHQPFGEPRDANRHVRARGNGRERRLNLGQHLGDFHRLDRYRDASRLDAR